jgi:RluA family pseudouridine synthase
MALDPKSWVIFIDDQLLAVDKPAGLATLVEGWKPDDPYLLAILEQIFNPLWVVHRLDKETSGVIVFARTAEAHRSLNLQFDRRQIEKIYLAFVRGNPEWEQRHVRLPLRPNGDRRHRTLIDPKRGKPSSTDLVILERFTGFSLIRAIPHTGRTHQIRAHLSAIGFPIVGDQLYGRTEIQNVKRLGLHAASIKLYHPASGIETIFEAPLPDDLRNILLRLREEN